MIRLFKKGIIGVGVWILVSACQAPLLPEMVYIPGGDFVMGCDSLGDRDESPAHSVRVKSFYLGKYEITQREWRRIMKHNPAEIKGQKRPVECVTWKDAQRFIVNLNRATGKRYRLPTEAEWEYAARGGEENSPSLREFSTIGWWIENSNERTQEVGLLTPNAFGLYDMIGNVHEWCAEPYDSLAYAKASGILPYSVASTSDEVVARGGNWTSEAQFLRITNRNHAPANYKSPTVGLRLAMDAE